MAKRVAIIQSSYIPWKGYFDIIGLADEMILLDDVQYTKRDWRNRNQINGANGLQWLTIPVKVKGKYDQLICETEVADKWSAKHWTSIQYAYGKSPHFKRYAEELQAVYERADSVTLLSDVNRLFIEHLCGILGVETKISSSMDYEGKGVKTDRLLSLCKGVGATHYISGPSARAYMEPEKFEADGIVLEYMDYSGYPDYPHSRGECIHEVSVLDLIFHAGPDAKDWMKFPKKNEGRA